MFSCSSQDTSYSDSRVSTSYDWNEYNKKWSYEKAYWKLEQCHDSWHETLEILVTYHRYMPIPTVRKQVK
jgi:hypothetical protein